MTDRRQMLTIDELKDMLLAQIGQVAYHYAPPVAGSYEDKGRYFTLNPGRADRSVGSFYIQLSGPKAGRWTDHATGQFGDVIDLIALHLGCSTADAVREARSYLGLQSASPEDIARRRAAAERAKQQRAEAERVAAEERERRRQRAKALWLSGQAGLRGTPAAAYLRDRRGIDLEAMGRQPGSLRFLASCRYHHIDQQTGEVIEGDWPAMLASVTSRRGEMIACHRTWLAIAQDGRWDKAPVPKPKKVLAEFGGGWIPIWSGAGARGGKAGPLSQAPAGTTVYITEGIEDALSVAALLPEARVLAAISLSNLASVDLPPQVARVVIVGDQDANPEARAALDRAVAAHRKAGRACGLWLNAHGGKDINDALRAAAAEDARKAGAA